MNGAVQMGRLQRDYAGTIAPVSTFLHVLYRHGLTMGIFACATAWLLAKPAVFWAATNDFFTHPAKYALALLAILGFFYVVLKRRGLTLNGIQCAWIAYLLYISIVEELAFRLFLPLVLQPSTGVIAAVVLSNVLFAGLHYFTLRWKWQNCLFACLGGIGLSRLLDNSGDLALVVLVHFIATFLNTPSQPGAIREET